MSKCFYRLFLCVIPFLLTISCTNNHGEGTDSNESPDQDADVDVDNRPVPKCGNGIVEAGEVCDGDEIDCTAIDAGVFSGGAATCLSDCSDYDTSDCERWDDYHPECKLSDDFFDAMPNEWTAFFTMKMSGPINDPANTDPYLAYLPQLGATIKGVEYDLGDYYGMYQLDSVATTDGTTLPAIMAVGVGNLTWPVTNKLASIWAAQTFVVVDDLRNWKDQAELEGRNDATIDSTTLVVVFEDWIEISGSSQYTRMECVRGVSKKIDADPGYEGAMFVCTNTEWAIGEQMKMMQYSHMVDDETELLAAMNEGLETNDPDYRTDVCRCWAADGSTLMDCEDMKDEFGVGELPDEEPDDDILQDDALLPDE